MAETEETRPTLAAYEAIARSARLPDLVALTTKIVTDAAAARRPEWNFAAKVAGAADEAKLPRAEAETPFGNALKVLSSGPEDDAERALASALWAHSVAEAARGDEDRLAGDVLWLAAHTSFDATPLVDRALGEDASDLWEAVARRVRRVAQGKDGALGRGEAIVGAVALATSTSPSAQSLTRELAAETKDPVLSRILGAASASTMPQELVLEGEATSVPRGPVATALLALTGILFVVRGAELFARFALAYRRPSEVALSSAGVRLRTKTLLLGRTLREREQVIVRSGLVRVVREVRFPRASFYAGLLALAVGSYLGVRTLVDGVRAASPSLLVLGLVIVALGIGADFVLGSLIPGSRGQCRIAFVPRTGRAIAIAEVDAKRADDAITRTLGNA